MSFTKHMHQLSLTILVAASVLPGQTANGRAPKIWDDKALQDWATPIAALGVRPGHFTSAEYYAAPVENLKTYPIYRPDKEPSGYWEWLQRQKPRPLVDVPAIHNRSEWIRAGEAAFRTLDEPLMRTNASEAIRAARDPKSFQGAWIQSDGTLLLNRWVITDRGVELSLTACVTCHARRRADGSVLWAASNGPPNPRTFSAVNSPQPFPRALAGESRSGWFWRLFTVPWSPDPRVERLRNLTDEERRAFILSIDRPDLGVVLRPHGSPYFGNKTPDLNVLRHSRYLDATATHRMRGPEDVARYAAFVAGADPMEFGRFQVLAPEQRRMWFRHADEVLYAIGVYLLSLNPPANPDHAAAEVIRKGRGVFVRQTCVRCHVPPNYTSGKLTRAEGFTPPSDHPNGADILNVSVGTDPGLAMQTRKGTGLYKIPSLRGVWYRPALLHDGSVASLEEMFDPDRLKPDHVPGGWKGPGVTKRAIPGHPFGLGLNADDKQALLAFLRSL
jgi:mono/diheme cytochrome c family protein